MKIKVGWNEHYMTVLETGSRPEQKKKIKGTSKYCQLASKGQKPLEGIPENSQSRVESVHSSHYVVVENFVVHVHNQEYTSDTQGLVWGEPELTHVCI